MDFLRCLNFFDKPESIGLYDKTDIKIIIIRTKDMGYMNTLKNIIILITLLSSVDLQAEESRSNWFVGSGLNISNYKDTDNCPECDGSGGVGIDLRAGYQFGKYLKLMVGYGISTGKFYEGGSNVNPFTVRARPQWEFDNGFLLYSDLGIITTSGESGGFLAGFGLGYSDGLNEIAFGYETAGVGNAGERDISGVVFQYIYHF